MYCVVRYETRQTDNGWRRLNNQQSGRAGQFRRPLWRYGGKDNESGKITVAGTTYFLVMDGEAMFTIRDIYGGTRLMLEKMEQDTREGFLETCNAAAILAERGELVRRRLGYEPGRIPERDDFALLTQPYEIVPLKRAIANAIKLGYGREITAPGDDEVDEGLEELNQKKTRFAARTITE